MASCHMQNDMHEGSGCKEAMQMNDMKWGSGCKQGAIGLGYLRALESPIVYIIVCIKRVFTASVTGGF
eukprot:scaffold41090_cov17-Tisochrysis_lutea.AAC.1